MGLRSRLNFARPNRLIPRALAEALPAESVTLVNEGKEFVERKKDGCLVGS